MSRDRTAKVASTFADPALEPIAGVDVGDRGDEKGEAQGQHDDVEHFVILATKGYGERRAVPRWRAPSPAQSALEIRHCS